MKNLTPIFIFCFFMLPILGFPLAKVLPRDIPTLEALIALHKKTYTQETQSLAMLEASVQESKKITEHTSKFQELKHTLNEKSNTLNTILLLASHGFTIGKNLKELTEVFTQFTSASTKSLFHGKPMCTWYYANAIASCSKEIKRLTQLIIRLGALSSGGALMGALFKFTPSNFSTSDLFTIVANIEATIERCKSILYDAYIWCSYVVMNGYHKLFIWDILNSDFTESLVKQISSYYA